MRNYICRKILQSSTCPFLFTLPIEVSFQDDNFEVKRSNEITINVKKVIR